MCSLLKHTYELTTTLYEVGIFFDEALKSDCLSSINRVTIITFLKVFIHIPTVTDLIANEPTPISIDPNTSMMQEADAVLNDIVAVIFTVRPIVPSKKIDLLT